MKLVILSAASILALGLTLAGCGEAEEVIDCAQICGAYEDCVDSDYDTSACIDRCETESDQDEDYRERADDCEACIDDKSCAEGAFLCADECVGIVP